ncbi:hypothetical protein ACQPYK_31375 [Streptosporangium sp. CA-135522]|uniref:hypothetical protein n=1 Tax=Streptosporangium sp. CA-135522 TaxID=3240072 RepID=UPI003D941E7B
MRLSAEDAAWGRMRDRYAGAWSIWRSDRGRWYATRRTGALSRAEMDAGLVMTVFGDDADELTAILAEQERFAVQALSGS